MRCVVVVLLCVVLLVSDATVSCGGVIYDEAIDGDLLEGALDQPSFVLNPGTSMIVGTTTLRQGFDSDLDGFAFQVSDNTLLTSLFFEAVDGVGNVDNLGWAILDTNHRILELIYLSSPGESSSSLTPLVPGLYLVEQAALGGITVSTTNYSFTFEVEATSSPVPEPTSLAIFGTMGLMLTGSRRRRVAC